MKRKLSNDTNLKSSKMLKLNSSYVSEEGTRKFNFELTEKKARKNLLKSADRNLLSKEIKKKSMNLRFSAGAYLKVAKELINECEMRYKRKEVIRYLDMDISIVEYKHGSELNGRHFDSKIVFNVNNQKVVMHCYNSTQNFKVEGSVYEKFVEEFLEPIVLTNIDKVKREIVDFDKSVSVNLGAKRKPLKPKSIK